MTCPREGRRAAAPEHSRGQAQLSREAPTLMENSLELPGMCGRWACPIWESSPVSYVFIPSNSGMLETALEDGSGGMSSGPKSWFALCS